MQAQPLYVKTPKGIDEIELRAHGLPMHRRKVLIVVDGKRDEHTLSGMFPGDDLPAILLTLFDKGFVPPLIPVAEVASPVPQATAPEHAPADNEERLLMARNFMVNTTRAYIGTNGSSLINQLDDCADLDALRHHFGAWRDAIQLSRDGRRDIGDLETKLAALLS
jgi:hypothetical protein